MSNELVCVNDQTIDLKRTSNLRAFRRCHGDDLGWLGDLDAHLFGLGLGGSGKDRIAGNDGDDYIDACDGDDNLTGDAGNDWLVGNLGADILYGMAGADVLAGGGGNDVLIDLDFDSTDKAEVFLSRMRRVWASPDAAPALGNGAPRARVLRTVETVTL